MTRNFLSISDLSKKEIDALIRDALKIKKNPKRYSSALKNRTLLMFFEQPSLRTRISFEAGMTQLGGHAIFYHIGESTIGKRETYEDFAQVTSRYCDALALRINNHQDLEKVARRASVPVINMMTTQEHPCQIISDMMTIWEKFHTFRIKLAYVGDGLNNTTHSLLLGAAIIGMDIAVASPKGKAYEPDDGIVKKAKRLAKNSRIEITASPSEAVKDADIVYTDSWMSYHIPESKEPERIKIFRPYQVNKKLLTAAKKDFKFMHLLPATRGHEVTADVIDGRHSIVYDQAENRLHAQKALLLKLIG